MQDDEGYTPTTELRFIERSVPAPQYGPLVCNTKHVLQQKWISVFAGHEAEWRDVPLVPYNNGIKPSCEATSA